MLREVLAGGPLTELIRRLDAYTLWAFNAPPELSHRRPGGA